MGKFPIYKRWGSRPKTSLVQAVTVNLVSMRNGKLASEGKRKNIAILEVNGNVYQLRSANLDNQVVCEGLWLNLPSQCVDLRNRMTNPYSAGKMNAQTGRD